MRILFVDNHREFAAVVTGAFLASHEVAIVPPIAAARVALDASTFDVALVDFDLDDGKGDELVRSLRGAGSKLKIVAVSSHDAGNAALSTAGADAVCGKLAFAKIEAILAEVTR